MVGVDSWKRSVGETSGRQRPRDSLGRPGSNAMRCLLIESARAPFARREPATRSIVEVDMLVVDDRPLLVPHDVVAVQTVAVLVEIIFAFCASGFLGGKDRLADFSGIGRAGLFDRRRQDGDGIVGPGALVIGSGLVGLAIGLAEGLRSLAGIFRV